MKNKFKIIAKVIFAIWFLYKTSVYLIESIATSNVLKMICNASVIIITIFFLFKLLADAVSQLKIKS